jgi:2-polyprenyl-3-methyl-5-hydroxy-6-metoxy-1,4-benzoquinol methylase
MASPTDVNFRYWDERAPIHARDSTGFYQLADLRAGGDRVNAIEAAELGDIAGKRILHLQCHIGTDTVRLARSGAEVTGLDFSPAAIEAARRIAEESGVEIDFVLGEVEEAAVLAPGPFDLVYTTWGTICWLPDVRVWARVIAAVLAAGGELYFADVHPGFLALEEIGGRPVPAYDYETPADRPLEFTEATTYTGDPTVLVHQTMRNWIHSLSSVIGALLDAGLTLVMLHEHEVLPWRGLPCLVPATDRLWRLPDGHPRMALSYSLRATKEQRECYAPARADY